MMFAVIIKVKIHARRNFCDLIVVENVQKIILQYLNMPKDSGYTYTSG